MSTKVEPTPLSSSDDGSRKADLKCFSSSIDLARKFIATVKTLASNSEYRCVAELIDQIPPLEQSVLSKDREIQGLKEKNRELEEESEKASRRLIRAYEREYDRFKDEKSALDGKISGLEELSKAQEENVNRLMASESELREKGRQVKNMWVAEKQKLSEANKEIKKMEVEANKALIENSRLDKELTQVRAELSGVRTSFERAKAKVSVLEQELCSKDKSLTAIEGLGVTLSEECYEKS
ncbi:Myosin heavy chain [Lasiodiplodia hormozganensis]|uniref:Myosin heavy chain n=1 Tax=Lasiodiplodia hormozganensis TaxID=869390 RepID=A0AA39WT16_9PEZI|nr:Myosin heavy chain [Lasiodiplodia hormozganensis]